MAKMNYLSIYDRRSKERLCFLENAYNIGYELKLNTLWTAHFTLPSDDPKVEYCQPYNLVEIFDRGDYVGLFRIVPSTMTRRADEKAVEFECEHVLATLIDDVLFGFHAVGNIGTYTAQSIRYILDRQTTRLWKLLQCDYNNQFLYTWENENLLSALFSIANPLDSDYMWVTNTSSVNDWYLSLVRRDTTRQDGELRYGKNMTGITRKIDPTNLCTRLYLLGYGEGDNQLTIKSVNNGVPYLDADTQSQWGIIAKIAVDSRFQDANSLLAYGRELLEASKTPYISYEVESAAFDKDLPLGGNVRVLDDELGISTLMPIVEVKVSDVTGARTVSYTVANKPEDIATSMADLSNRQRITELYSQGSVSIDSATFADNADPNNPATLRFYIPDNVVRINEVNFTYTLSAFRAYSKSAEAGGGSSQTSSSGGGSSQTSSSGGGSSQTSSTDGGATVTSASGGGSNVTTAQHVTASAKTTGMSAPAHDPGIGLPTTTSNGHYHLTLLHEHTVVGGSHTHKVEIPAHTHNVKVPSHAHTINIPAHTHSVSIPAHTHSVTIPAHKHGIEYGIYTGSRASSATIKVDGVRIPVTVKPYDNIDITGYLSADDNGKIQRGMWHEIEIKPDALTRIEASVQITVYINPKGVQDL